MFVYVISALHSPSGVMTLSDASLLKLIAAGELSNAGHLPSGHLHLHALMLLNTYVICRVYVVFEMHRHGPCLPRI